MYSCEYVCGTASCMRVLVSLPRLFAVSLRGMISQKEEKGSPFKRCHDGYGNLWTKESVPSVSNSALH